MSAYQEFTGKTVEEALRLAREAFGVGLDDLDFEILTPGSRGVLGMGAEPARIVAAPRAALGGAAPKREAASAKPLPPPPPRDDRGPRRDDRGPRPDHDRGPQDERPAVGAAPVADRGPRPERADRGPRRDDRPRSDRGPRRDDRRDRGPRGDRGMSAVPEATASELGGGRGSLAAERAELQAAEASPEALAAARVILEQLMQHLGYRVDVEVMTGETNRLNVTGSDAEERDALGALIGRKGERLSALQHLVNLMLSKQMGEWTRVLVDVEDYRGRRERQLTDLAQRAAARVIETGRMLQLEPMPALERRWVHLALRDHPDVVTQSVGEEPNRRIVVLPRSA
jgi:spoIIIJ-associated protein